MRYTYSIYEILQLGVGDSSQEKMLTDNDIPLGAGRLTSSLLLAAISSWRKKN